MTISSSLKPPSGVFTTSQVTLVRWPSVRLHVFHLGSAITTRRVRDMPLRSRNTKKADGLDGSIFNIHEVGYGLGLK